MALAGTGLVAIWNDIKAELREDFFEWHPREHMVERLGIPGFLRGRRYAAIDAAVEFLTLYEIRSPEVLLSEIYQHRVTNPTPWSSKTLPGFFNNERGACRIEHSEGCALGGFMYTLRLRTPAAAEAGVVAALRQRLSGLSAQPRITGVHLLRNDETLTGNNAGNQRGRVITLPQLVVLIEGSTADGVRAVAERTLEETSLRLLGADDGSQRGLYQLEYSIQNLAP